MRALFLLYLSFSPALAQAARLSVVGPCDSAPAFVADEPSSGAVASLGDFTVQALNAHRVPFNGSREGIASILGSPVGDEALEVLSDSKMHAYGWCVKVDGKLAERMPHETPAPGPDSEVVWFYAYATYDSGQWVSYCSPSYELRSPFICGP